MTTKPEAQPLVGEAWFRGVAAGAGCPVCDETVCYNVSHNPDRKQANGVMDALKEILALAAAEPSYEAAIRIENIASEAMRALASPPSLPAPRAAVRKLVQMQVGEIPKESFTLEEVFAISDQVYEQARNQAEFDNKPASSAEWVAQLLAIREGMIRRGIKEMAQDDVDAGVYEKFIPPEEGEV